MVHGRESDYPGVWEQGARMNEITTFNATGVAVQDETTMPHSTEAEQQLLGAILTNNDVYDRVASLIGPQHFFEPVHARIFEIAASRIAKNNLASPVTLKAFIDALETLAKAALHRVAQNVARGEESQRRT